MPAKTAPNNGILYGWATGEDYWGGPMNDNLQLIDTMLHPVIRSMSWSAPPPDAENGDRFVVATNPTGAWSGQQGKLAVMMENTWGFYEPRFGIRARLVSTGKFVWFNGVDWVEEDTGDSATSPTPPENAREYHVSVSIPYQPEDNELLVMMPVIKAMILPKGASGSQFSMLAASVGQAVFKICRNDIQVGSITVNQGQYDGVFNVTGDITFSAGDRLTIYAPPQSILGFKNFGFVLRFNMLGTN
ncbi:DUF2793 domain-containing protein [Enterobacter hormaechei]|uniref:DUF2793 domain-containing protein n=1 Tax=Enterobacter hormaechei TaxID=158836 RepID=UPI003D36699A